MQKAGQNKNHPPAKWWFESVDIAKAILLSFFYCVAAFSTLVNLLFLPQGASNKPNGAKHKPSDYCFTTAKTTFFSPMISIVLNCLHLGHILGILAILNASYTVTKNIYLQYSIGERPVSSG